MKCVLCQTAGCLYLLRYTINVMIWSINRGPCLNLQVTKRGQDKDLVKNRRQIFIIQKLMRGGTQAQDALCIRDRDRTLFPHTLTIPDIYRCSIALS